MEIKNLASPPLFLGDNLALDFINSEYGTGDDRHDCFDDPRSVIDWLETVGLVPKGTVAPPDLLEEARQLRDAARAVVHAAMNSSEADLTVINSVLERASRDAADMGSRYTTVSYRCSFRH
jgi:predicted RNA-binding Zn ribbon-like protein